MGPPAPVEIIAAMALACELRDRLRNVTVSPALGLARDITNAVTGPYSSSVTGTAFVIGAAAAFGAYAMTSPSKLLTVTASPAGSIALHAASNALKPSRSFSFKTLAATTNSGAGQSSTSP